MSLGTLLDNAGSVITSMIDWVGIVISKIFGTGTTATWSSLAPFLFIGLGITLILTAVGVVRSFIGGRDI